MVIALGGTGCRSIIIVLRGIFGQPAFGLIHGTTISTTIHGIRGTVRGCGIRRLLIHIHTGIRGGDTTRTTAHTTAIGTDIITRSTDGMVNPGGGERRVALAEAMPDCGREGWYHRRQYR